jgi:gamma-glutamyltranspeptidase
MSRGAKPGERRGGRAKGQLNKASIERAALAERIVAEAEGKHGRKLGRELLEEFALMFGGLAAAFQPVATGPGGTLTQADLESWANSYKEPLFEKYAKLAAKCADAFADFQSPRLSRVHVAAPPPDSQGPIRRKFTINIFDHNGRPAPRHIDVRPRSDSTAPVAALPGSADDAS